MDVRHRHAAPAGGWLGSEVRAIVERLCRWFSYGRYRSPRCECPAPASAVPSTVLDRQSHPRAGDDDRNAGRLTGSPSQQQRPGALLPELRRGSPPDLSGGRSQRPLRMGRGGGWDRVLAAGPRWGAHSPRSAIGRARRGADPGRGSGNGTPVPRRRPGVIPGELHHGRGSRGAPSESRRERPGADPVSAALPHDPCTATSAGGFPADVLVHRPPVL
jgi:hypothetical protein